MPRRWLLAYLEMMPRLQAERSMLDIQAAAFPHYSGKRGQTARERIWRGLERLAAGRRPRESGVLRTGAELRRWLALAGGINASARPSPQRPQPAQLPLDAPPDFDLALFESIPGPGTDGMPE